MIFPFTRYHSSLASFPENLSEQSTHSTSRLSSLTLGTWI
jgi:hypothetical protein